LTLRVTKGVEGEAPAEPFGSQGRDGARPSSSTRILRVGHGRDAHATSEHLQVTTERDPRF
ncbi:MAG: hypothetical protein RMM08_13010, partial [Armatimonadota bacterium]|nr:hypothetical protein [Armatimonadota bacterium]